MLNPGSPASSSSSGTTAVYFDQSNPAVTAYGLDGSTKRALRMNSDGAIKVYDIANGSITINAMPTTSGVYLASTAGTINVALKPGTIAVSLDPGYELGSIKGINSSINAHILSTGGTLGVRVGQVDGTVAVYFSPSNPAVSATFSSASLEVVPTTGSRIMYDANHAAERVLIVGTSTAASIQVVGITNSIAVHVLSTGGTLGVNVGKISDTVAVFLTGTAGTLGVNVGKISDTVAIYLGATAGTIGVNVGKISDTIAVYLTATAGTLRVKTDPSSAGIATDDAAFNVGSGTGAPAMGLFDDTSTDSVDEGDAGILRMTGNRILMTHTDSTASIFTVSGSTSGVSASGVQLVAPSANASFKVYAFSLQTTGIVSCVARFTNGGGSATEFWRGLVTPVSTSGVSHGANMVSGGPGCPLFVTGVSTTLALHLDTATLVHYSVSYTKESA